MNRERITRLADRVEQLPDDRFTMSRYQYNCGTAACIAGHAVAQMMEDGLISKMPESPLYVPSLTKEYLGISDPTMFNHLFKPEHPYALWAADNVLHRGYISKRRAAAVLRYLAETGEVDWSIYPVDSEVEPIIDNLVESVGSRSVDSLPLRPRSAVINAMATVQDPTPRSHDGDEPTSTYS